MGGDGEKIHPQAARVQGGLATELDPVAVKGNATAAADGAHGGQGLEAANLALGRNDRHQVHRSVMEALQQAGAGETTMAVRPEQFQPHCRLLTVVQKVPHRGMFHC